MKRILAIGMILLCGVVISAPVKSIVGAREAFLAGSDEPSMPTAADYVQDGLVAHWDGEWNIGVGEHSSSTIEWIDLTGNQIPLIPIDGTSPMSFGENYLIGNANIPHNSTAGSLLSSMRTYTVECVFVDGGMTRNKGIFSNGIRGVTYGTFLGADTWDIKHTNAAYYIIVGNNTKALGTTSTGERQNFSLSLDGTAIAYKNGVMLGTCSVGTKTRDRLTLGFTTYTETATSGDYGYSQIYTFRIYDRALTPEEIAYNYSIDKIRFNLP